MVSEHSSPKPSQEPAVIGESRVTTIRDQDANVMRPSNSVDAGEQVKENYSTARPAGSPTVDLPAEKASSPPSILNLVDASSPPDALIPLNSLNPPAPLRNEDISSSETSSLIAAASKMGAKDTIVEAKQSSSEESNCRKRRSLRYISALLRSIGLRALNYLFQWRLEKEQPKIAIERNRWMAIARFAVHIPPLIGCIVLIYYNLMTIFVLPSSTYSILQFVAKLHEVLMQASIAAIITTQIRYEMTNGEPAPFGSLFAGLRVTDISYLWSPDLIGVVTAKSIEIKKKSRLALHILFSVLLATAVGPSSAILMIPRFADKHAGECLALTPTPLSDLLPLSLNSSLPGISDRTAVAQSTQPVSLNYIQPIISTQTGYNLKMFFSQSGSYESSLCSVTPSTFATMISLCDKVGQGFIDPSFEVQLKSMQPYVSTTCTSSADFYDVNLSSPLEFHMPDSSIYEIDMNVSQFVESYNSSGDGHIIWLDVPPQYQEQCSLLAVVAPQAQNLSVEDMNFISCVVQAAWIPSTINGSLGDVAGTITSGFPDNSTYAADPSEWAGHYISISAEWAQNASLANQSQAAPSLTSILNSQSTPLEGVAHVIVSSLIATGISSVNFLKNFNVSFLGSTLVANVSSTWDTSNPLNRAGYSTPLHIWTYSVTGYSLQGISAILAVTVLSIYCLYVLGFLIYSLVGGISSSSWDSIAEMMALALNSTPPSHLGSLSAGIETLKVYQEPIAILANKEDGLEIVFQSSMEQEATDFMPLEKNKAY